MPDLELQSELKEAVVEAYNELFAVIDYYPLSSQTPTDTLYQETRFKTYGTKKLSFPAFVNIDADVPSERQEDKDIDCNIKIPILSLQKEGIDTSYENLLSVFMDGKFVYKLKEFKCVRLDFGKAFADTNLVVRFSCKVIR